MQPANRRWKGRTTGSLSCPILIRCIESVRISPTGIQGRRCQRIRDHDSLLRDSRDNRAKLGEDLLARAKSQKQSVDAQFDHMKANKERADKAVDEGNTVLKDAERTLRTLEGSTVPYPQRKLTQVSV